MHKPVLLNEVVEYLNIKRNGRYVDGTLGLGGHAEGILRQLNSDGRLLGLDLDPRNLKQAEDRLQPFGDQTITRQVNFRGLQEVLQEIGWMDVDGMIFDLGLSSPQLDDPKRGFSFGSETPLDMRLDPQQTKTALSVLQGMSENELADVLREYGEFRNAKKASRYLLNDIATGRIQTTSDVAQFCVRVMGRRGKIHPATRLFLALRSLVNEERESLADLLRVGPGLLSVGGRMAIISFHSVEDKAVKNRFRDLSQHGEQAKQYRRVTRKPVAPTENDIAENPRARSAKLRVLERIR